MDTFWFWFARASGHEGAIGGVAGEELSVDEPLVVESPVIGEETATEMCWLAYCRDPTQWYDNQASKKSPNAPDFRHKRSKRTLWIDGWHTPGWVRERL